MKHHDPLAHCDPDTLTLAGLGAATLDAGDVEHLHACALCAGELRDHRAVVDLARGPEPDDEPGSALVTPPPEVWGRVAAELELSRPVARRWQRRRPGRIAALAAAAAVLALVAGGAGWGLASRGPQGDLVARTPLGPVEGSAASPAGTSGTAQVLDRDGNLTLALRVDGLAATAGYYEVWLIDPATSAMVSLGSLPSVGDTVDLPVPHGVDTAAYSLVDVSDEPLDGDPAHSRSSVARGQLAAT